MTAKPETDENDQRDPDREALRCEACHRYQPEVTRHRPRCRSCEAELAAEHAAARRDYERPRIRMEWR